MKDHRLFKITFLLRIKFIYHTTHLFKGNKTVVLEYSQICDYHHNLRVFHHLKKKPVTLALTPLLNHPPQS